MTSVPRVGQAFGRMVGVVEYLPSGSVPHHLLATAIAPRAVVDTVMPYTMTIDQVPFGGAE
ncbi:hypothetical protein [Croceibacterium mercuriale]|uniref:hypothetical protein n=1 Tax=Croceibacterium mercuriale TaxID=1572751 RepID=UPI00126A3C65|nr:hypothetical protein [Croceibacterium mercuriale]